MRGSRIRIQRSSGGGVLPLLMLAATIIAALVLVAVAVCTLLLVESKLRSTTENYGLQAGVGLNKGDRIGEMNLMIERSREAVYTSRQTYNEIATGAPHVEPLARLLLDDTRDGARKVDEERQSLAATLGKELEISLSNQMKKAREAGSINLMFFRLQPTEEITVEVGSVRDIPSNATAPIALDALKSFDKDESYFYDRTDYYRPETNARLPAPDNDLKFLFASLAPRIKDTIADARLITGDDFDAQVTLISPGHLIRPKLKNLPSAVRLVTCTGVDAPMNLHEDMAITTISTAAGSDKEE